MSLPTMPISSQMTANIGTPSTNAANIRWTSAAIQTAPRAPMPGKWPYAWLVSAAACRRTVGSAVISVLFQEEWARPGEVDRHVAPDLGHQLDRDLGDAALQRVLLEPRGHHATHERGDLRQPGLRVGAPGERAG